MRAATGFDYDEPDEVSATPEPSAEELALLRGPVRDEMLDSYPEFCARVFDRRSAAA